MAQDGTTYLNNETSKRGNKNPEFLFPEFIEPSVSTPEKIAAHEKSNLENAKQIIEIKNSIDEQSAKLTKLTDHLAEVKSNIDKPIINSSEIKDAISTVQTEINSERTTSINATEILNQSITPELFAEVNEANKVSAQAQPRLSAKAQAKKTDFEEKIRKIKDLDVELIGASKKESELPVVNKSEKIKVEITPEQIEAQNKYKDEINAAQSLDQLYEIFGRMGRIYGSKGEYSPADIQDIITDVRNSKARPSKITDGYGLGLRSKIITLLAQERLAEQKAERKKFAQKASEENLPEAIEVNETPIESVNDSEKDKANLIIRTEAEIRALKAARLKFFDERDHLDKTRPNYKENRDTIAEHIAVLTDQILSREKILDSLKTDLKP